MCNAALEHIKGVRDDMGFDEASKVFQAQVAAFVMLLGEETRSTILGAGCTMALAASVCEAIVEGTST
jgi:hypothetical protein